MLFALGTTFSSADFLKSLIARTSSTASTGSGQAAGRSFDAADASSSPEPAATGFRLTGKGISPDTMKALLAAQGQSSGSDATAASRFAASANDFESEKSDNMPSGGINVVSGDGTTTTTTITLTMLHLEPTPLDMSVLTHLTGRDVAA